MKSKYYIRTNGRANAWPIFLGSEHPFYSKANPDDLSNASFSIIKSDSDKFSSGSVRWEIIVDAGNNTASYLIRNENRIPETIVLTHPHMDHALGVDWIVQSYYYKYDKKRKYPLYATNLCWEFVKQSYPHLNHIIDFNELKPGIGTKIDEVDNLKVTPFPVFHGSTAIGASMLVFEFSDNQIRSKVIFTGDMLCPLLREKDYIFIRESDVIYIDCNNRFSYPKSNHGSLITTMPGNNSESKFLTEWKKEIYISFLIAPHLEKNYDKAKHSYFDEFLSDNPDLTKIPFSIIDFIKRTKISEVNLVHYSGYEDKKFYNQDIVDDKMLEKFANENALSCKLTSKFSVPKVGDIYELK
jgi:glyoxylase-like metal-dependent hydrolase (beta-lactamase superfamily II)